MIEDNKNILERDKYCAQALKDLYYQVVYNQPSYQKKAKPSRKKKNLENKMNRIMNLTNITHQTVIVSMMTSLLTKKLFDSSTNKLRMNMGSIGSSATSLEFSTHLQNMEIEWVISTI